MIPGGAEGESDMLETIQSNFEGLDDEAISEAMGSTEDAVFELWRRTESRT